MAYNSSDHYDATRESHVYVSAEIQGTLEKKGVLGNKSKTWCTLQGSTLYLQKKQGDVVTTLDLTEAHLVRKIASDISGTQFEICIKKKSHVFICPTNNECTDWVRALQSAMALKNSKHNSEFFIDSPINQNSDADMNVYNEIEDGVYAKAADSKPGKPSEDSQGTTQPPVTCKVSDYADVYDAKQTKAVPKENDYYDVEELGIKPGPAQVYEDASSEAPPVPPVRQASKESCSAQSRQSSEQIYEDAVTEPSRIAQPTPEQEDYSDAYSTVNKVRKSQSTGLEDGYSVAVAEKVSSVGSAKKGDEKDEVYSEAKPARVESVYLDAKIIQEKLVNIKKTSPDKDNSKGVELRNDDDDDDPFQTLMDALTDHGSPIPEFSHPLTEEDWKPVEDLDQFLKNNRQFCRASSTDVPANDDPVSCLKAYLATLNVTS